MALNLFWIGGLERCAHKGRTEWEGREWKGGKGSGGAGGGKDYLIGVVALEEGHGEAGQAVEVGRCEEGFLGLRGVC